MRTKFIFIVTIILFTFGIGSTVMSYTGCLDTFAGEVAAGLTAIDSFYNDDGTFYVNVNIESKIVSTSMLSVATIKKGWLFWGNPTNYQYKSNIGSHYLTYVIPTGQYRMYFESNNSYITFSGAVYDNN